MTSGELALVRQWISEGAKFEAGSAAPASAPATTPPAGDPAAMKAEMRTWTNSAGSALQAAFVAMNGANVTLKKDDGSQFDYPLANLSPESQALAKQLAGQ